MPGLNFGEYHRQTMGADKLREEAEDMREIRIGLLLVAGGEI